MRAEPGKPSGMAMVWAAPFFTNHVVDVVIRHFQGLWVVELVYAAVMFEALAEAIENLVVPAESDALAEVFHLYGRLGAKAALAAAEFDHAGGWELDGSASMTAWMRVQLQMTNEQANRILRRGRRVRLLPATAAAWEDGRLSSGQVEIIVANVTNRRSMLFAEHEADLVPTIEPLDIVDTLRALRDWAAKADAILDGPEPPEEPAATVQFAKTLGGRGYLHGSFDAPNAEVIAKALDLAMARPVPGEPAGSWAERQGQAMVDVFRHFLDHQSVKLGKRHRPHVNVTIPYWDLVNNQGGRMMTGLPVDPATLHRLVCDANIHRVITDGASSILDYGRATRTIPPAVYTSLVLRDWGCRFPGCDRPAEWCEGHHIRHWEDGGPTRLSNLVLLCSKHHHVIHLKGWQIRLHPTGTVEVTDPNGQRRTSDPPGTAAVA